MKFLMEHEMAFDANELAFPSISGCHAIVYQTSAGLYGYHNYGGSAADKFKPRAVKFFEFIRDHGGLANPGSRIYGCSFVGNNGRGYSAPVKDSWKAELVAFATELTYTGKISGYDLDKRFPGINRSALVEYRTSGTKCDVFVREWLDPGADAEPLRMNNPGRANHKIMLATRGGMAIADINTVVTGVNRNNLAKISKEKLR